jgi:hypothetical protein
MRPCPICDGTTVDVLMHKTFALPASHLLPDAYDVVACTTCGLAYADTPASQATYDRYYADASKYTGFGAGISATDQARFAKAAATLAAHFGRSARIADVGSGNGGLVQALRSQGFERAFGIDPSPACAALLGDAGRVGTLWNRGASADCVVLSHGLELVREGRRAIRALVSAAPAVYIEVPDVTRYAECLVAPFQDINVEHINHFSFDSLSNALRSEGISVVAGGQITIESAPGMQYPAVWVIGRTEGTASAIARDTRTLPAMREYIARSRALLAEIHARLESRLKPGSSVAVWGTGQTALTLYSEVLKRRYRVTAFTDNSTLYHGTRIDGIPVVPPGGMRDVADAILVGSVIHEAAIRSSIEALGIRNEVVSLAP